MAFIHAKSQLGPRVRLTFEATAPLANTEADYATFFRTLMNYYYPAQSVSVVSCTKIAETVLTAAEQAEVEKAFGKPKPQASRAPLAGAAQAQQERAAALQEEEDLVGALPPPEEENLC